MIVHQQMPARSDAGRGQATRVQGHILQHIPSLRAFARSLTRNPAEADDLLQETLVRALANIHRFTPGTNLKGWLFTIQRNIFYTNYKRKRREIAYAVDDLSGRYCEPEQDWSLKVKAVRDALQRLPYDQKEALVLVGGTGLSYEEAADVCGCALGTIKSRVSRGRARLLELLHIDKNGDFLESEDRPM